MKKNIILSSIVSVSLLSLVGCGGSSSPSNPNTGTGYYVDSAVEGVDYVCGSQSDKTGSNGKFIFEKGQGCKFSLAGIPLRTTKSDELADGKKIVEDNLKVAKLLQSIDDDNNVSNGIQITKKVLTALTTALEESNSTGKLPEDEDTLTIVVAEVGATTGVSREVRTQQQVQSHLAQTQTEIIKKLLSGKTLYTTIEDKKNTLESWTFNSDFSSVKWQELVGGNDTDIGNISNINGSSFMVTDSDSSAKISIVKQKADYIVVHIVMKDGTDQTIRAYFDKEKAKAYFNTIGSAKELLAGKTLYTSIEDKKNTLESWTFNNDFSSVKWQELVGGNNTDIGNISNLTGLSFTVTDSDSSANITITEQKDDYLVVHIVGKNVDQTIRAYFNKAKAQAYFGTNINPNNGNNHSTSKFTPPLWIQGTWMDRSNPNFPTGWKFTTDDVYSIIGNHTVSGMKSVKSGDSIEQESNSTTYKYSIKHSSLNSTEGPFTFIKVGDNKIQLIDSLGNKFSCTKE